MDFMAFLLDNMQKVFYPEEWIDIDMKLSKSELYTILIVDRYTEVTMGEIANQVNVSMSTATGIVDRLVKKKYLIRQRSTTDRRVVVMRLTDKGKELVLSFKNTISKYMGLMADALSEEEIALLKKMFIKIVAIFNDKHVQTTNTENVQSKVKKIEIE